MLWTYDRPDRLAELRDHAAAVREALRRRLCDAVREGDRSAVATLEARHGAAEARWRCLSSMARTARRHATMEAHR